MKLKNFLGIISLLPLAACGDSPSLNTTPPVNNPTPGPIETDYYVSPASTECRTEIKGETWHGMENILGYGYDITGNYLSVSSMRGRVIDINKLPSDALTVFAAPATSMGEVYAGSDTKDFLTDLMANVGIAYTPSAPNLCFIGTLTSASPSATMLMYISWQRQQIGGILTLQSVLEKALDSDFERDIKYMRAKSLVDYYGTHFLCRANVGTAVKTIYSAFIDADSKEKLSLARQGADAAEAALLGKLGPDLTLTLSGLNNYGASLTKIFSGGDPDLIEYNSETGILGDNAAWQESGAKDNYSLISLSEGDLLPISAAISDPEIKEEVDNEIKRRISDSQYADDATVPLLQNTNGRQYRYVTGYDESFRLENEYGLISFGVLGALYTQQMEGSIPLYTKIDIDGNQTLSLIQPDESWEVMGYVMQSRSYKTISLYEISDGARFAYTIEAANSYGPRNEWHPTGAVFYLLRP
ncbi:MAG: hypothetical protein HDR88_10705 [Bacteroides sp.]|nr:hypothetical protein [Bacteroides sp.]